MQALADDAPMQLLCLSTPLEPTQYDKVPALKFVKFGHPQLKKIKPTK